MTGEDQQIQTEAIVHVNEENMDNFDFDEWTRKIGLNRKTSAKLRENDLISRRALSLLTEEDAKELEISLGQRKELLFAIKEFNKTTISTNVTKEGTRTSEVENQPNMVGTTTATVDQPQASRTQGGHSEITLDNLFSAIQKEGSPPQITGTVNNASNILNTLGINQNKDRDNINSRNVINSQRADLDPLIYLSNPNPDYLDITDFIPQFTAASVEDEQTLHKGDNVRLVIQSGPKKPKLHNVNQAMYMAASSRILAHMLHTGKISYSQVPHYLAYQVKIGALAQRYDWNSVLQYDREYRRMQQAFSFPWGSDSQHLAQVHLVEKIQNVYPSKARYNPGQNSHEPCKLYNHSTCPYGIRCRYAHICTVCKQNHSQLEHQKRGRLHSQ